MGGVCISCANYKEKENECKIRSREIEEPRQTTCHQHDSPGAEARGPIYNIFGAKVSIVLVLPYYKGSKPKPVKKQESGSNFLYIIDENDKRIEFNDQKDYIKFCKENMSLEYDSPPSISKENVSSTKSFVKWLSNVTGLG